MKQWLITFHPEMSAPMTVTALREGFNDTGVDLRAMPPAESVAQANDHAKAWALPSDEQKPRVHFGRIGECA